MAEAFIRSTTMESKREWEELTFDLGICRGEIFNCLLMAGGIMMKRKILKRLAIVCPALPRIKDSGRTLRMILQWKIVPLNPTDSETQADLCFIRSRILFHDINLFHSSFS